MFWHELVLNGVGGRTVEEAKRNMSYKEFIDWVKYRNVNTTLNSADRLDKQLSLISAKFASALMKKRTGNFELSDFTFCGKLEEDIEGTPENIASLLMSVSTPG